MPEGDCSRWRLYWTKQIDEHPEPTGEVGTRIRLSGSISISRFSVLSND
jgi:hypothetical protein